MTDDITRVPKPDGPRPGDVLYGPGGYRKVVTDTDAADSTGPVSDEALEAHREELARHFNLIDTPKALICECGETFAYHDHEAQADHRIRAALAAAAPAERDARIARTPKEEA